MGLLDRLTGSRAGQPGVAPVAAGELRAVLLALGDGEPWEVRDGSDHDCDLVAEWQIAAEQPAGSLPEGGLTTAFRVRMKLDQTAHEVRHNSQQSGSSWRTGTSSPNRAQAGGGFGGGPGAQPPGLGYNFSSSDLTNPLRDTVTSHGWGWKTAFRL